MPGDTDKKVVDFPAITVKEAATPEELASRTTAEAHRIAGLPLVERALYLNDSAHAQRLGIPPAALKSAVTKIVKDNEKKQHAAEAEERRQARRIEKQREAAAREERQQREAEQRRLEKEAERKRKDKQEAFAVIIKLPSDQHEAKMIELAKHLDEDVSLVREEFAAFADAASSSTRTTEWHVEPWPEAVPTAQLLQALTDKIGKHVVARAHEIVAIALWVLTAWVHNVAARYSPNLVARSAEPDSGKTTMLTTCSFLVPKPFAAVESTGPSIYRFVDQEKPTLLIDEADDLFKRKADVRHILNAGWRRGTKIPRQVQLGGISTTQWFDPFCPKILGLLGRNLPRTLATRSIQITLRPKKLDEKIVDATDDDEEFTNLRSRQARWAADNSLALKGAKKPLLPANFNNRIAANWLLILAVAELAGGKWPKQARDAAERVSRTGTKPSIGRQLLAAIGLMFVSGRKEIPSADIVAELVSDPEAIWCEYQRGGPITQRQVADLLEQFEIFSHGYHPTKHKNLSRRGYKLTQFADAFERYLPPDHPILPIIRSSAKKG